MAKTRSCEELSVTPKPPLSKSNSTGKLCESSDSDQDETVHVAVRVRPFNQVGAAPLVAACRLAISTTACSTWHRMLTLQFYSVR